MTRRLCAYAPDPEPPLGRLILGWAVARPHQILFVVALFAGAFWSLIHT